MNKYERLYRLTTESILILLLYLILSIRDQRSMFLMLSIFIIHMLFWLLNGHFFVLMRYIINRKNDPSHFISYANKIYKRVNKKGYLLSCAAFGSLSKGNFSSSSDFDVRLISRKGFLNSLLTFNHCTIERFLAFLHKFPLDIYVFNLNELQGKMNLDEPPIILFDPDKILRKKYQEYKEFNEFNNSFRKQYLKG